MVYIKELIMASCLVTSSQAFVVKSSNVHTASRSSTTALNAESSTSLQYRQGSDWDSPLSTSTSLHATGTNGQSMSSRVHVLSVNDEHDIESRIEAALVNARDMDRRYGLCTPNSIKAWQVVDDLYAASAASQLVEEKVKSVLGEESSIWSLYERS